MRAIEIAAGEMFRRIGMDAIADDDPPEHEELLHAIENGGAWTAVDPDGRALGYLIVARLRGSMHVDQVTVHPDGARRGIGCQLIDAAAVHARSRGVAMLTLTTFAAVAWNAPYYRRLGFAEVPGESLPADLVDIVVREAELGLARWPRVVMRRAV